MKTCFRCKATKPREDFYKKATTKDGLQAYCIECQKDIRRGICERDPGRFRRYGVTYRARHATTYQERMKEYRKGNRAKQQAKASVAYAKKKGRLIPKPCAVCGSTRVDGHHPDYSKPLEVEWLCRKHHYELHAEERERMR